MVEWNSWNDLKPEIGKKVVLFCNDLCSTTAALVTGLDEFGTIGLLDAEDGYELPGSFSKGAIWCYLPDDTALAFMECYD